MIFSKKLDQIIIWFFVESNLLTVYECGPLSRDVLQSSLVSSLVSTRLSSPVYSPIQSPLGYCLELDPARVERMAFGPNENRETKSKLRNLFRSLEFTLVYNGSDVTYGWNGFMKGMTGMTHTYTHI